jgi:long-chain acyl-CoA synthetase
MTPHPPRGDVLLTGATGFLGTALLARLVQAPYERRVWALVRADDERAAAARVRAALTPLVDDVDAACARVVAVPADLEQPWLGLDTRQTEAIAAAVTEVIHAAASVSFTLPLDQARAINVEGTRRVLDLAARCGERGAALTRFAHVSTAYVAGTHHGRFTEDDADVGQGFHNSYERTKLEAEQLVRAQAERLPVQILRPSIVVGEEEGGWTSSFNVIYTPLRAFARGALPAIPARRGAPVDVVSISYVAAAILALALTDAGCCRTYHLTSGDEPATVAELLDLGERRLRRPAPRVVAPLLYRRVLHPLMVWRSSGARRGWLRRADVFFPYFDAKVRFDTRRARAALEPIGLRPAPLAAYFDALIDYAESCDWGRARADAVRVGRRVGPKELLPSPPPLAALPAGGLAAARSAA